MSNEEKKNRDHYVNTTARQCCLPGNEPETRLQSARTMLGIITQNPEDLPDFYLQEFIDAYRKIINTNTELAECIQAILELRWGTADEVRVLLQTTLTPQEETILAQQITKEKEAGLTITSLLENSLSENDVIFLDIYTINGLTMLEKFLRRRARKCDSEKIYIALNIPEDLREDFNNFLEGNNAIELRRVLYGNGPKSSTQYDTMTQHYRSILRKIEKIPGVEFSFIGSEETDENTVNALAQNMCGIIQKEPRGKVFVLNAPLLGFTVPITNVPMTNLTHQTYISLPHELRDVSGDTTSVTFRVCALDNDWTGVKERKEIRAFSDRHQINTSFVIPMKCSVLAGKLLDPDCQETIGETHDGIIVYRDDHDASDSSIPAPEIQSGNPTPSPVGPKLVA